MALPCFIRQVAVVAAAEVLQVAGAETWLQVGIRNRS